MVHLEDVPARDARIGTLEHPLDGRLQDALERLGVEYLYTHQAEAITALREGRNVIVATPAASGKSLCYHLPVLEALLQDRGARALYLYPTKSLPRTSSGSSRS